MTGHIENGMSTTIQIDEDTRDRLAAMKLSARESYNDVIERLLEDLEELDEKTIKEIQKAERDVRTRVATDEHHLSVLAIIARPNEEFGSVTQRVEIRNVFDLVDVLGSQQSLNPVTQLW